jgi:hypothetical protein
MMIFFSLIQSTDCCKTVKSTKDFLLSKFVIPISYYTATYARY